MNNTIRSLRIPCMLLVAACAFSGCNSIEGHTSGAVQSASEADMNYTALDTALGTAIERLKALRAFSGNPDSYLQSLQTIEDPVADAGDKLGSARESLIEHGKEGARLRQEEANKFTDPDLAKNFSTESERIRGYYDRYEQKSGGLFDSIKQARAYFADIRRAVELNRSPAGVEITYGTLDKAVSALRDAKDKIPDSQAALAVLRKNQPKPQTTK